MLSEPRAKEQTKKEGALPRKHAVTIREKLDFPRAASVLLSPILRHYEGLISRIIPAKVLQAA